MKNDTLNVFMAFLHVALRKKLSIVYFIERPVHRSVYESPLLTLILDKKTRNVYFDFIMFFEALY